MKATRGLLYATLAALPLYMVRVHAGPVRFGIPEVLLVATALSFAAEAYVTDVRPRWPGAFTGPMVALGAAMLAAAFTGDDVRSGLAGFRTVFAEPALLLLVASSVLMTPAHLRRACSAALVGGTALSVAVLVIVVRTARGDGLPAAPPFALVDGADGFLLVPLAGLALSLLIGGQGERRFVDRVYPAVFLLTGLPAVLLGLGRDAWFATAIVALSVAAFHTRRRLGVPIAVVAACGVLLAVPFEPSRTTPVATFAAVPLWSGSAAAWGWLGGGRAAVTPLLAAGVAGLLGLAWLLGRTARWQAAVQLRGARLPRNYATAGTAVLLAVGLRGIVDSRGVVDDEAMLAALGAGLLASAARLTPVRLRSLARLPQMAHDIEPAELPMPADIPRRTGRYAPPPLGTPERLG